MNCPICSTQMVKAQATNFGPEYDYCRNCKKELSEMTVDQRPSGINEMWDNLTSTVDKTSGKLITPLGGATTPTPVSPFNAGDLVLSAHMGTTFTVKAVDHPLRQIQLDGCYGAWFDSSDFVLVQPSLPLPPPPTMTPNSTGVTALAKIGDFVTCNFSLTGFTKGRNHRVSNLGVRAYFLRDDAGFHRVVSVDDFSVFHPSPATPSAPATGSSLPSTAYPAP